MMSNWLMNQCFDDLVIKAFSMLSGSIGTKMARDITNYCEYIYEL